MNPSEPQGHLRDRKIYQFTANILRNQPVSSCAYCIDLAVPLGKSFEVFPGQFFMVSTTTHSLDPLLRRPFSVFSLAHIKDPRQRRVSILFRAVGQGTRLMAGWSCGQSVDMLGPLGKGYSLAEDVQTVAIFAGGFGIASLFALAESILLTRQRREVRVYLGSASVESILMKSELEDMGAQVHVSTEDGSLGKKGVVTDWLEVDGPELAKNGKAAVYACGPFEMLATVTRMTHMLSLPCQVSLEARMACGVGSCLGCPVKIRDQGYQMVCKQGPVFDATEIDWDNMERLL